MNTLLSTGVFVKGTKYYKYNDENGNEQRLEGEQGYKKFVSENYETLVKMMYDLGYFNLTNDATVTQIASVEPSEIAGASVSEEELKNEGDTNASTEQFI